jgi:hypothetical protein
MSFNKNKTNPELGQQVHDHLVSLGLQTPTVPNKLTIKQKVSKIEKHMAAIMETLGLDLSDDSLMKLHCALQRCIAAKSSGAWIQKTSQSVPQLQTRWATTKWL